MAMYTRISSFLVTFIGNKFLVKVWKLAAHSTFWQTAEDLWFRNKVWFQGKHLAGLKSLEDVVRTISKSLNICERNDIINLCWSRHGRMHSVKQYLASDQFYISTYITDVNSVDSRWNESRPPPLKKGPVVIYISSWATMYCRFHLERQRVKTFCHKCLFVFCHLFCHLLSFCHLFPCWVQSFGLIINSRVVHFSIPWIQHLVWIPSI